MYPVYCKSPDEKRVWRYFVVEHESNPDYGLNTRPGDLVWRYGDGGVEVPAGDTVYALSRCGDMCLYAVLPEEAEAITGLHYPAAMDRLRELVHESGGA